ISPRRPAVPNSRGPEKRSVRSASASPDAAPASAVAASSSSLSSARVTGSGSSEIHAQTMSASNPDVKPLATRAISVLRDPRDDTGEQLGDPGAGLLSRLDDLLVAEGGLLDAGREAGHERQSEDLESRRTGGDRLERRRHAHEVAAQRLRHADLGGGLVLGAGELHVDALREVRVDLAGDAAQARRVEIREVDEVRVGQRRGPREV